MAVGFLLFLQCPNFLQARAWWYAKVYRRYFFLSFGVVEAFLNDNKLILFFFFK